MTDSRHLRVLRRSADDTNTAPGNTASIRAMSVVAILRPILLMIIAMAYIPAAEITWAPVNEYTFTDVDSDVHAGLPTQRIRLGQSPYHPMPSDALMPPQGFVERLMPGSVEVGGRSMPCQVHVWTIDPTRGVANILCQSITAWCVEEVDTPSFVLSAPVGGPLPVPAHCVRYVVAPCTDSAPINRFAVQVALAVTMTHVAPTTIALPRGDIAAQRFAFVMDHAFHGHVHRDGTLVVSPQVDGGIVQYAFIVTGSRPGTFQTTLSAITPMPVPTGITAYDHGQWGFAPPPLLQPVHPQGNEICRFEGHGGLVAVSHFDPGGQDLASWFHTFSKPLEQRRDVALYGGSNAVPVLQSPQVGYADETAHEVHLYWIHDGHGFHVTCRNPESKNWDSFGDLLTNWRWAATQP